MTASIPGNDSSWSTIADRLNDALAGDYIIERELGRGGMAAVFLGYEPALDRRVAIKVMSPGLLPDASMVQRFRQEAVTVANLSHPNIITIHAVREIGDLHCFVMKFVVGRPLAEILAAQGTMPLAIARHILCQVGSALTYAHRQQVIHRDIKPANIMIDATGEAMVTDFGIAKVAESQTHTQTGAAVGTPIYMSPEQCRGVEVTWSSDQYALGVVAYEMLTGSVPFTGSALAIMQAHTDRPPAPIVERRPDCPDDLDAAVRRMLAKTAAERWPTMSAALAAAGARELSDDDPARVQLAQWATAGLDTAIVKGVPSPIPRGGARTTAVAASRLAITAPGEIGVGDTVPLKLTAWSARGAEIPAPSVTWTSDAPDIVRVESQGLARAIAPGSVIVRAAAGEARAAISLTVTRPPGFTTPPAAVVPAPVPVPVVPPPVAAPVPSGKRSPWLAVVAVVAVLGAGAVGGFEWWQSRPAPPEAPPALVPVVAPPVAPAAAHGVRWIQIEPPPTLRVGGRYKLAGAGYDVNHRPVANIGLAWSVDNPVIAAIDPATGELSARGAGTANVRASAAGREATVRVTVR